MANTKISALTEDTEPTSDDNIVLVDDIAGTPTSKRGTLGNSITKAHGLSDGLVKVASGVMTPAVADTDYATTATKLDDFATPDDNTDLNVTTTYHGLVPKAPGGTTQFLRADASWATPSVGASSNVDVTVWNATGATLTQFSAVYLSGWNTANALPEVTDARADSALTMPAFGIVTADIADGASGTVTVVGNVGGLATSGYSEGDALYVDPSTAGAVTTTKPTGANLIQKIAIVTRSHATLGTIQVFGAGRSNDIPNFTAADKFWYGGASGVATEGAITSFARTVLDDADAGTARATLDVDQAGTDNSTDVTLAGSLDYLTITGQAITRNAIDLTTDVTGVLPEGNLPDASTTAQGVIEVAIASEVNTGTDATRAVSPDALAGSNLGIRYVALTAFDYTTDTATGDGSAYFHVPAGLNGMDLVEVHAEVITAGTTGTTDIQIANVTQAADMLSTKITIDSAETGSDTAATAAVIDTANDDVATNDLLRIDVDAVSTTAAKGLIVTMGFRIP